MENTKVKSVYVPSKYRQVGIRDYLLNITDGNSCAAALLLYFQNCVDYEIQKGGSTDFEKIASLSYLNKALIGEYSKPTVIKAIKLLVDKKYVEKREYVETGKKESKKSNAPNGYVLQCETVSNAIKANIKPPKKRAKISEKRAVLASRKITGITLKSDNFEPKKTPEIEQKIGCFTPENGTYTKEKSTNQVEEFTTNIVKPLDYPPCKETDINYNTSFSSSYIYLANSLEKPESENTEKSSSESAQKSSTQCSAIVEHLNKTFDHNYSGNDLKIAAKIRERLSTNSFHEIVDMIDCVKKWVDLKLPQRNYGTSFEEFFVSGFEKRIKLSPPYTKPFSKSYGKTTSSVKPVSRAKYIFENPHLFTEEEVVEATREISTF